MVDKKNDNDDLKGFAELLQEQKKNFLPQPPKSSPRENDSGLEQLTFLEEDALRLDKMIDFFDNKLKNSFIQTAQLIEKQRESNQKLRQSIIPMITGNNTIFMQSLRTIWNTQFKEINQTKP